MTCQWIRMRYVAHTKEMLCCLSHTKDDPGFIHNHYSDVIITAMESQITSLTIVYSTVYSGPDHRKHQSSASLAFVRGLVNSPYKGPVTRKMYPCDDVISSIRQLTCHIISSKIIEIYTRVMIVYAGLLRYFMYITSYGMCTHFFGCCITVIHQLIKAIRYISISLTLKQSWITPGPEKSTWWKWVNRVGPIWVFIIILRLLKTKTRPYSWDRHAVYTIGPSHAITTNFYDMVIKRGRPANGSGISM